MTNLTQNYQSFLNFITTTPSAAQALINDAALLNKQLNAVRSYSYSQAWRDLNFLLSMHDVYS